MEKPKKVIREVIIVETTVLQELEYSRDLCIKCIMRTVDQNCSGIEHKNVRSVVLDAVNQMHRDNTEILERILEKYSG
jgi:hypothetical protein